MRFLPLFPFKAGNAKTRIEFTRELGECVVECHYLYQHICIKLEFINGVQKHLCNVSKLLKGLYV